MPLTRILPYAALLLVAQVALDAAPTIVAEREGGMGLGSALIIGSVAQVAALALGATAAAYAVERRSRGVALIAGVVLLYAGLMAIGTAPMGDLTWLTSAFAVAGLGYGAILTVAFATAAAVAPRSRGVAIGLLLVAVLVARSVAGTVWALGPIVLVVVGGAIIVLSVLSVRSGSAVVVEQGNHGALPAGRAVSAGVLLGLGTLLAVAGADPSRLAATLLAGFLGVGAFETLDTARTVMLGLGLPLLVIGMTVLIGRTGVDRGVRWSTPALALATIAALGTSSAMSLVSLYGRSPEDGAVAASAAVVGGGALGLAAAAWSSARGVDRRAPGMVGGGVIFSVSIVALVVLAGGRPAVGDIIPVVLIGGSAIGLGLVALVLRLVLAEVPNQQRGLAAAGGVVAASVGSVIGSTVGVGQGVRLISGEAPGFAPGAAAVVIVAAASVVLIAVVVRRDGLPQ
ncbi:hypothetical protein BH23CHL10_BH23CHL10_10560 [soil metagenome]